MVVERELHFDEFEISPGILYFFDLFNSGIKAETVRLSSLERRCIVVKVLPVNNITYNREKNA